MIKLKFWQELLLLVILMQPCYLSRRARAVYFGPPLWGGSSPPEHINPEDTVMFQASWSL